MPPCIYEPTILRIISRYLVVYFNNIQQNHPMAKKFAIADYDDEEKKRAAWLIIWILDLFFKE